jgi:hypothetical protein
VVDHTAAVQGIRRDHLEEGPEVDADHIDLEDLEELHNPDLEAGTGLEVAAHRIGLVLGVDIDLAGEGIDPAVGSLAAAVVHSLADRRTGLEERHSRRGLG